MVSSHLCGSKRITYFRSGAMFNSVPYVLTVILGFVLLASALEGLL